MIYTKWFEDISELSDAYLIREKVFIEEQHVPKELELDGTDDGAIHLVIYDNDASVATGRIIHDADGKCFLGRIAVLKEHRGKGYGDLLVRALIRKAYTMGHDSQYIHAQIQALPFYEKLGFTPIGKEYMDANIPHIKMVHVGDVKGDCL